MNVFKQTHFGPPSYSEFFDRLEIRVVDPWDEDIPIIPKKHLEQKLFINGQKRLKLKVN